MNTAISATGATSNNIRKNMESWSWLVKTAA
jgi:hypothetical protein